MNRCTLRWWRGSVVRMKSSLEMSSAAQEADVATARLVDPLLGRDPLLLGGAGVLQAVLVGAGQEPGVVADEAVPAREGVGVDRRVRRAEVGGVVDVVDRCRQEETAGHCPQPTGHRGRAKSRRRSASRHRGRPPPRPPPAGGWHRRTSGLRRRPDLLRARRRLLTGGSARDDEHVLSARRRRRGTLARLAQSAVPGLLETFRELAADRHPSSVPAAPREVSKRGGRLAAAPRR